MGECGVFLDSVCKGNLKIFLGEKLVNIWLIAMKKYTYTGHRCLGLK
jgi:hypothetical protein